MEAILNFETLVKSQLSYLQQIARNYTTDESTAEDLLQDTIVRIWSNRQKFTMGTNFKAWASVIMRNVFINDYRKRKRLNIYNVTPDENILEGKAENSGEQQMVYDDLLREVHTLKTMYRKPIELYNKGFSYREIAEDMGVSVGTIKSRMHVARGYLKQRLAS
ncbi:MAG: RNA polymerase sigma factor [Saprospiraceae bacterium]|nr:RNA polymerase sigma factor [Lewinella sp.]